MSFTKPTCWTFPKEKPVNKQAGRQHKASQLFIMYFIVSMMLDDSLISAARFWLVLLLLLLLLFKSVGGFSKSAVR